MRDELEEQRDRYLWGIVQRGCWSSLVVLLVVGALCGATIALAWERQLLWCAVGLLAGGSVAIAASGSARGREQAALVVGAVTLPLVATRLAGAAADGPGALEACRAALVPFLVHAGGALLGGVIVARIWTGLPPRPAAEADEGHGREAPTPARAGVRGTERSAP